MANDKVRRHPPMKIILERTKAPWRFPHLSLAVGDYSNLYSDECVIIKVTNRDRKMYIRKSPHDLAEIIKQIKNDVSNQLSNQLSNRLSNQLSHQLCNQASNQLGFKRKQWTVRDELEAARTRFKPLVPSHPVLFHPVTCKFLDFSRDPIPANFIRGKRLPTEDYSEIHELSIEQLMPPTYRRLRKRYGQPQRSTRGVCELTSVSKPLVDKLCEAVAYEMAVGTDLRHALRDWAIMRGETTPHLPERMKALYLGLRPNTWKPTHLPTLHLSAPQKLLDTLASNHLLIRTTNTTDSTTSNPYLLRLIVRQEVELADDTKTPAVVMTQFETPVIVTIGNITSIGIASNRPGITNQKIEFDNQEIEFDLLPNLERLLHSIKVIGS